MSPCALPGVSSLNWTPSKRAIKQTSHLIRRVPRRKERTTSLTNSSTNPNKPSSATMQRCATQQLVLCFSRFLYMYIVFCGIFYVGCRFGTTSRATRISHRNNSWQSGESCFVQAWSFAVFTSWVYLQCILFVVGAYCRHNQQKSSCKLPNAK